MPYTNFSLKVKVYEDYDVVVSGSFLVNLLLTGTSSGILSGIVSATTSLGVFHFTGLYINLSGTYQITAWSSDLCSDTSSSFQLGTYTLTIEFSTTTVKKYTASKHL